MDEFTKDLMDNPWVWYGVVVPSIAIVGYGSLYLMSEADKKFTPSIKKMCKRLVSFIRISLLPWLYALGILLVLSFLAGLIFHGLCPDPWCYQ